MLVINLIFFSHGVSFHLCDPYIYIFPYLSFPFAYKFWAPEGDTPQIYSNLRYNTSRHLFFIPFAFFLFSSRLTYREINLLFKSLIIPATG